MQALRALQSEEASLGQQLHNYSREIEIACTASMRQLHQSMDPSQSGPAYEDDPSLAGGNTKGMRLMSLDHTRFFPTWFFPYVISYDRPIGKPG